MPTPKAQILQVTTTTMFRLTDPVDVNAEYGTDRYRIDRLGRAVSHGDESVRWQAFGVILRKDGTPKAGGNAGRRQVAADDLLVLIRVALTAEGSARDLLARIDEAHDEVQSLQKEAEQGDVVELVVARHLADARRALVLAGKELDPRTRR